MKFALIPALLFIPMWAQQAAPEPGKAPEPAEDVITTTVKVVLAPTTVTSRSGEIVTDLAVNDFKLYDNDKLQELNQDVTVHPLSIVVAVQANNAVSQILPKIQKIGSIIGDLVMGDNSEAEVVAFDHRIRVIQDFTSESAKISDAMKKIKPGSTTSKMIDAVTYGVNALRNRPADHRRVIILISETRDRGSEGRVRESMMLQQAHNVVVYTVNISHLLAEFTDKGIPPAPPPIPPTAMVSHGGITMTPTTVSQNVDMGNFVPVFEDIFKGVKGIFVDNPAEVFTKASGGREFSFVKQETLENDLVQLGRELHNQYLLSYKPNNLSEGGFHKIQVVVNRPDMLIRSRPGYWKASEFGK